DLVALDLDSAGAEVLFDDCLAVGGERPLLRVRADGRRGASLRVVRSTLIGARALLEVRPAGGATRSPALRWLGWDALLCRCGAAAEGTLVAVGPDADSAAVSWRAYNCLYAGWSTLLSAGGRTIAGDDLADWQRHWGRLEGDVARPWAWPEQDF